MDNEENMLGEMVPCCASFLVTTDSELSTVHIPAYPEYCPPIGQSSHVTSLWLPIGLGKIHAMARGILRGMMCFVRG